MSVFNVKMSDTVKYTDLKDVLYSPLQKKTKTNNNCETKTESHQIFA